MHVIPLLSTDIWLLKKILHKGLGKVKFIQDIYLKVHLPHLHIAADWIEFWKVLTILISVTFSLHKQDMKVIYNFLSNFFSRDYKLKEISYKNVFLDDWKKWSLWVSHWYQDYQKPQFLISHLVGYLVLLFWRSWAHCSCSYVCHWGSRISQLVSMTVSISKSMTWLIKIKQFA